MTGCTRPLSCSAPGQTRIPQRAIKTFRKMAPWSSPAFGMMLPPQPRGFYHEIDCCQRRRNVLGPQWRCIRAGYSWARYLSLYGHYRHVDVERCYRRSDRHVDVSIGKGLRGSRCNLWSIRPGRKCGGKVRTAKIGPLCRQVALRPSARTVISTIGTLVCGSS